MARNRCGLRGSQRENIALCRGLPLLLLRSYGSEMNVSRERHTQVQNPFRTPRSTRKTADRLRTTIQWHGVPRLRQGLGSLPDHQLPEVRSEQREGGNYAEDDEGHHRERARHRKRTTRL